MKGYKETLKAGRETEEHTSWEPQRASQAEEGLSKDNGGVPFTFTKKKKISCFLENLFLIYISFYKMVPLLTYHI